MPPDKEKAPPGGSGASSKIIAAVNSDKSKNSHSTHISQGRRLLRHPGLGDRGANAAPDDFDPRTHPILATHFFGVKPPHPIGPIAAALVASPRRQRAAEHLHNLGPRPVLEALVEVETGVDLDRVLAAFAQLEPKTVSRLDGDHFPPMPLREVS